MALPQTRQEFFYFALGKEEGKGKNKRKDVELVRENLGRAEGTGKPQWRVGNRYLKSGDAWGAC